MVVAVKTIKVKKTKKEQHLNGLAIKVNRGAKLLDKQMSGWARKVVASKLDTNDRKQCVVGQLYGSCNDACDKLFITTNEWEKYGFDALSCDDKDYELLDMLWKNEIRNRKYTKSKK